MNDTPVANCLAELHRLLGELLDPVAVSWSLGKVFHGKMRSEANQRLKQWSRDQDCGMEISIAQGWHIVLWLPPVTLRLTPDAYEPFSGLLNQARLAAETSSIEHGEAMLLRILSLFNAFGRELRVMAPPDREQRIDLLKVYYSAHHAGLLRRGEGYSTLRSLLDQLQQGKASAVRIPTAQDSPELHAWRLFVAFPPGQSSSIRERCGNIEAFGNPYRDAHVGFRLIHQPSTCAPPVMTAPAEDSQADSYASSNSISGA